MRRIALALALLLAACEEPDFWAFRSTNRGGPDDGFTGVVIWVSDSPADGVEQVFVTIDRVELAGPSGTRVLSSGRRELELLQFRNGRRALLAETDVEPGTYDVLRIRLAGSGHRVVKDGQPRTLVFAHAQAGVVEFPGPYLLGAGERLELHADFNVRRSIAEAGGIWQLDPYLSLADALGGGRIAGSVHDGAGAPLAATVSVQAAGEEILSTRTDPDGSFLLGPLPAGAYVLVVTAPGFAPAFEHGIGLTNGATSSGHAFTLAAAATGSLAGTGPAGTARVYRNGDLVAWTGVDPGSGSFAFPDLPAGAYDVQVWAGGGPLASRSVVVEAGRGVQVDLR